LTSISARISIQEEGCISFSSPHKPRASCSSAKHLPARQKRALSLFVIEQNIQYGFSQLISFIGDQDIATLLISDPLCAN